MIGTPSFWETRKEMLQSTLVYTKYLLKQISSAHGHPEDINLSEVKSHKQKVIQPDVECEQHT